MPMLLAEDGRRLSKRDKDLDLGVLRQHISPEALIGVLAYSAGLIPQNAPISAKELATVFDWKNLQKEAIYLDGAKLLNP